VSPELPPAVPKRTHPKIDVSLSGYSNSHAASIFGFIFAPPAGTPTPEKIEKNM